MRGDGGGGQERGRKRSLQRGGKKVGKLLCVINSLLMRGDSCGGKRDVRHWWQSCRGSRKGSGLRGEEEEKQSPQKQGVKMMRKEVITTWREKEHFSNFLYLQ